MTTLTGGCHCRNIKVEYETSVAPEDAKPRACQCSFCRQHQSRAVSDPGGSLHITVDKPELLSRYTFAMKSIEFLVCRECGVYVAGFMADPLDDKGYATLMVSALDERQRYPLPSPTVYDAEDKDARTTRRRKVWTPAVLTIGNAGTGRS
ncbi:MAG: GFA family protein [Hyphomicrobiaceae bacterium]